MSDPSEAKLSGCDSLPLRDFGELLNDPGVLLYVLALTSQWARDSNPTHARTSSEKRS